MDAVLTDDRLPAALSVAPDRRSIAALEGASVELFAVEPHAQTGGLRSRQRLVVAGPLDDATLAAGRGSGAAAEPSATSGASAPEEREAEATCASYSPDGRLVATAAADGLVRIWAVCGSSSDSAASSAARPGVSASSAAGAAASAAAPSGSSLHDSRSQSLQLVASLRGSWRPVHVPQPRRQGDRWIYPDDPRRGIALAWLPLPVPDAATAAAGGRAAPSSQQHRHYALAALNQDGGTVVWSLRASFASAASAALAGPLACLGATALPCLGPRVRGHAGAPRAHRKAPRLAGQKDAGKWWPRAAVLLPHALLRATDGGSAEDIASAASAVVHLAVLESSERGGAVLARWSLEIPLTVALAQNAASASAAAPASAPAPSFSPRLPSMPSASAAEAMALDDAAAQLDVTPRALAVTVSLSASVSASPAAAAAAASAAAAVSATAVTITAEPVGAASAAAASSGAGKPVAPAPAPTSAASTAGAGAGAARVLSCAWTVADARPAVALAIAGLPPAKPAKKNPLTGEMEPGEVPPAPPLPVPLLRLLTEAVSVGAGGLLLVGTADNRVSAFEPHRLACVAASAPLQADAPPMQALAYAPRSGAALAAVGREVVVYPLRHAALRGPAAPSRVSLACILLALLALALLAALGLLYVTSPQGRLKLGLPDTMPLACGAVGGLAYPHPDPHCAAAQWLLSLLNPDAAPAALALGSHGEL